MKNMIMIALIAMFSFAHPIEVNGQPEAHHLDQIKLMEQFLGIWQMNRGQDSVIIAEYRKQGKAFVETDYDVIRGNKSFRSIWGYSFSPQYNNFKIFELNADGSYKTWIGFFEEDNKWVQQLANDFNLPKEGGRYELVFDTQAKIMVSLYNSDKIRTWETSLTRIER